MTPTTPREVTRAMREFLATLETAMTPTFLPFTFAAEDYQVDRCLDNCEAENRRTGAEVVFGWTVWELPAASFVECVFHAVVRREGRLLDITPRRDHEDRILFVPDRERIARRETCRSWETWASHKRWGRRLEATRSIVIENLVANRLP